MSFIEKCSLPTVWCGKGEIPARKSTDEKYYVRRGTPTECMKIGFGAGMHSEKKKLLDPSSLQNIKYTGEVYENNFFRENIRNIPQFIKFVSENNSSSIKKLLDKVYRKKGGIIDKRAYNSALVFAYKGGHRNLPSCLKIRPSEI
jgi:hypothetical protein